MCRTSEVQGWIGVRIFSACGAQEFAKLCRKSFHKAELIAAVIGPIETRRRVAIDRTFQAVAEIVTDAVVSADSHGSIIYVNKGGERLFGWEASQLAGRPLTVLVPERFHESTRRGLLRYISIEPAEAFGNVVELIALHKDGHEFPIEISLARWEDGPGRFFTAIVRDITERKRRDEELRAINAQLEVTNQELETFSYSVSHDLRAPVRAIDGFSAILEQDYADKLDNRGRDCLHRVRAAAQRMYTLIDALLMLSRVTREEMRRDVIDLSALARSVATELQRIHPERKVEFNIAPGIIGVGDGSLVRVALENLIGNAWKFTSRQPKAQIEFGAVDQQGSPVYFVRDNGAGFDMIHADKLFGAFQRLHTTDEFPGTGIGLPTVQRIVRRHGGSVWADAEVDGGATFWFTLAPPVKAETPPLQYAMRGPQ
jgi:PAS domain S-box-containing protein